VNGRVLEPALFHRATPGSDADADVDGLAPVLAGSRCDRDGTVVFPYQDSCPRCSGRQITRTELPGRGTLWSWTTQHFAPKSPYRGPTGADFVVFPVGYVDLGDVIVEARLHIADVTLLRIGMPLRLTWLPLWTEPDGTDVLTYAFEPDPAGTDPEPAR
jgi:uncharacterized OB-fold protein